MIVAIAPLTVSQETKEANIRDSAGRGLPDVSRLWIATETAVVVAGGPSLNVDDVRACDARALVVAVNGAYRWCLEHGISPDMAVCVDGRPENAAFFAEPVHGCRYVLATQCAPETYDALEGRDVYRMQHVIGSTGTTAAIGLLRARGLRRVDVFGMDSCAWDEHHAYAQRINDDDQIRPVWMVKGDTGSVFWCAPWHLRQANDIAALDWPGLAVHGDGLIAAQRDGAVPLWRR